MPMAFEGSKSFSETAGSSSHWNAGSSQLNGGSPRFAEAEHHLRGTLSRTHRKIVGRIHQRVAFGLEHEPRCGHFALDDFGIDAVQQLRIPRARSSRRNIIGDDES